MRQRPHFDWRLRTRTLALGERTLLMGILNVTPDSFSDGGRFTEPRAAFDQALRLLDEGADILDLGGESTRPNAVPISATEEQDRVLPVIAAILAARPEAILSVDTYHAATAQATLKAGAEIVNDVSGLTWDSGMAAVLAAAQPGAVLMHTRGTPQEWPSLPPLKREAVLPLVLDGLAQMLALARNAGICEETIVLDPGFGFGKLGAENVVMLAGFGQLHALGRPLLAGISRKRFLTAGLGNPDDQARRHATTGANAAAILAGAHLLRVHDVAATHAAASVADAILREQSWRG
jgi:dihydropteroate synthase